MRKKSLNALLSPPVENDVEFNFRERVTLLPGPVRLQFHEDNQAMLRVAETGHNPSMRHLQRVHRVSVAWLHEIFAAENVEMFYEDSIQNNVQERRP